ncbi:hypothetical protein J2W35_006433 [Variovorax boronicumulans]|uniref:hypothetical protein n=1 Tax=Variovorax boronicumulans TaxID=436515 RepID=UPI002782897A|nr:hypothetical protein [Variovorax boronicumulans]MDQ0086052.1 hypothetical protein [Variovorax boronicumulans]
MRYSAETETAANDEAALRERRSSWRATLVGALIGLLIVMALLMKWLMEHQVASAAQRRMQEMASRAAAARCFELTPRRVANACRKELEAKSAPVE